MSDMIREQSEDFKMKAINLYASELKISASDANQRVDAYLTANVNRFIAMEEAGVLEAYIDQCPPN
jgi:hypothetical protein